MSDKVEYRYVIVKHDPETGVDTPGWAGGGTPDVVVHELMKIVSDIRQSDSVEPSEARS